MATISWSDLPKELLDSIAKRLDTRYDVVRFRAVCSSWRSSISPPQKSPPLPLMLPFSTYVCRLDLDPCNYLILSESTVYRLESPPNGTGSSQRNGWLVKVKETESSKVQILPLFESIIHQFPQTSSKVLNLLNFRISEISKAYNIHYVDIDNIPELLRIRKVVVSSNPVSTAHDYAVLAINNVGILCCIKLGDDKWTVMRRIYYDGQLESLYANDIVHHKGQFYVFDTKGKVVVLNYSFEVIETFTSPTCDDCPGYMLFFESLEYMGNLLLVHKHFNYSDAAPYCDEDTNSYVEIDPSLESVEIKVYKLDEEESKWNEVNSLGDRVLFLCHDCCFSVSVQDFAGCKGNCIYFIDLYSSYSIRKGLSNLPICVFNLEDGSGGPLVSYPGYSNIFWSPPTWPWPNSCWSSRC